MKWNKESDEELKKLILLGKKHEDIANIIGATKSSVRNRCYRLGLNVVNHKENQCNNCGNFFIDLISRNRKFCSKNCSASFNNLGKTHSEESKNKIRIKLTGLKKSEETLEKLKGENNSNWKGGVSKKNTIIIKGQEVIDKRRKCRYCNEKKHLEKRKMICETCRTNYYEAYRPSCEFRFNINDFKDEFNFNLIEQHGWYSPSNKGNNLGGVSRDHLYSVRDGFINKVSPEIISHPANCILMKHSDNSSKNSSSSITLEELKERIKLWNNRY